jgi:hypothetical protein
MLLQKRRKLRFKNYLLSVMDNILKIEYIDITADEFYRKIQTIEENLSNLFTQGTRSKNSETIKSIEI